MAQDNASPEAKKTETKKEGKARKPSALKRDLQSEKRRLRNRSFRASVQTALRSLEQSLEKKEGTEALKSKLNAIYSLMDQGVKKNVYKPQKAARTKSRLALRCAKA